MQMTQGSSGEDKILNSILRQHIELFFRKEESERLAPMQSWDQVGYFDLRTGQSRPRMKVFLFYFSGSYGKFQRWPRLPHSAAGTLFVVLFSEGVN